MVFKIIIDFVFENRLKSEIAKSFRISLEKANEDLLPLSDDEKRAVTRFLKAFLKHMNITLENLNETSSEQIFTDLKEILKSLNKTQVENFILTPPIKETPMPKITETPKPETTQAPKPQVKVTQPPPMNISELNITQIGKSIYYRH